MRLPSFEELFASENCAAIIAASLKVPEVSVSKLKFMLAPILAFPAPLESSWDNRKTSRILSPFVEDLLICSCAPGAVVPIPTCWALSIVRAIVPEVL